MNSLNRSKKLGLSLTQHNKKTISTLLIGDRYMKLWIRFCYSRGFSTLARLVAHKVFENSIFEIKSTRYSIYDIHLMVTVKLFHSFFTRL